MSRAGINDIYFAISMLRAVGEDCIEIPWDIRKDMQRLSARAMEAFRDLEREELVGPRRSASATGSATTELPTRDSDGTATAALCEDIAVPQDCQARLSPTPPLKPPGVINE